MEKYKSYIIRDAYFVTGTKVDSYGDYFLYSENSGDIQWRVCVSLRHVETKENQI
jgi:hypothetical protein